MGEEVPSSFGNELVINLKGYLVGNGCTDEAIDGDAFPSFAAGKSLISKDLYRRLEVACGGSYWNRTITDNEDNEDSECLKLLAVMYTQLQDLNVYDILEECYKGPNPAATSQEGGIAAIRIHHGQKWPLPGTASTLGRQYNWAHLGSTPPCTDSRVADAWLNDPEVRSALHAAPISDGGRWELCSSRISYTRTTRSTILTHVELMLVHHLRALVYSGDADLAVPHTGSERWTSQLGYPVKEEWGPWYYDNHQVAGYAVEYYGGLTYATIKGAGHMVPETSPKQALTMFERFIKGKTLHSMAGEETA